MTRLMLALAAGVVVASACTVKDPDDPDDAETGGSKSEGTGGAISSPEGSGGAGGVAQAPSEAGAGSGGSPAEVGEAGNGGADEGPGGSTGTAGTSPGLAGAPGEGGGGASPQGGAPSSTGGTPTTGSGKTKGTVVWSEDFEDGAKDWSVTGGVWAVGEPTAAEGPKPFEGSAVAGTVLGGDYGPSADAWLVSPEIEVPAAKENPRFAIRYWYELAAGDAGYIYLRVDGGGWQQIMAVNQSGDGGWRNLAFPLGQYADRVVEFGFRLISNASAFAPGFYLDDARFITGEVGMDSPQDFEGGWGDWSAYGGVWDVGAPTATDGPQAFDGDNVAGTILSGDYADSHDAWLVSPIFDVPSETEEPRISLDYWYELTTGDAGYLYARVDGGGWQQLFAINQSGDGEWRHLSFPLNAYADRQVELGFRLITNAASYAPGIYVDNVRFETGEVELPSVEGFEDGFAGWSNYGGVWAVGKPTAEDGPEPYEGEAVAGTVLSGDYGDSHDAWLVSPRFLVPPDSADPTVAYWYWYELAAGDAAYTYIRVDGGGWVQVDTLSGAGDGSWRQQVIQLEKYKDRHVEVGLRLITNAAAYAPGWYIDDVSFNLE